MSEEEYRESAVFEVELPMYTKVHPPALKEMRR